MRRRWSGGARACSLSFSSPLEPNLADPAHLAPQRLRAFDDVEHRLAEAAHQRLRMDRADAADPAGRVAIVTGAGRGLGRPMAEGLAVAGYRMVANAAREPGELEPLVTAFSDHVMALQADVAEPADCARTVEAALAFSAPLACPPAARPGMKLPAPPDGSPCPKPSAPAS